MFFNKPGQYRVYVIAWLPMIVTTIVIAAVCFCIGRWTARNPSHDIENIQQELSSLRSTVQNLQDAQQANKDQVADLQIRLESTKTDDSKNRLILLTCLMNENFAALQAKKPEDIIFVERNWKISRMPKYLDLNDNDTEWMKQFLNQEEAPAQQAPPQMPQPDVK